MMNNYDKLQLEMEAHRKTWRQLEQMQRENELLRSCLADARYRIEQGRVWSGMGWTLTGLSANGQQKALDAIDAAPEAALSQQAEPVEPAPAQDERVESYLSALEKFECEGETFLRLYDVRDLIAELRRPAQTEQKPVTVPEGWKLVPSEPTRAMCLAAQRERREYPVISDRDSPVVLWRAMLSAAPVAQSD